MKTIRAIAVGLAVVGALAAGTGSAVAAPADTQVQQEMDMTYD